MNNHYDNTFGTSFERIFVSLLAIATGIILIYLAAEGPLLLNHIQYKTADIINNQIVGQDIINMFLLSPLLIAGGISLYLRKSIAPYLLIVTPLYLIYFVLSYTLGCEWSSPKYTGNSETYIYYFLFVLIASLILLLYALAIFPQKTESHFKSKGLRIYSFLFSFFLLIFASMWVKEIQEVISTGTTRAYDIAPTAFWVIRVFDLGFTIPLGLISVYLLWVRPNTTYPIQFMFYGFFLTMIVAVNTMGFLMFIHNDPTFLVRDLIVFIVLALLIFSGFLYIIKNYKTLGKGKIKG